MKKHYFITALLLIPFAMLHAQDGKKKGYPYQKTEVTFAVGMVPDDLSSFFNYPSTSITGQSPMEYYHWGKFYTDDEHNTPIFSAGIHHHISKHWAVGLQLAYQQMWRQSYRTLTNEPADKFTLHNAALMGSIRYYYAIHEKYAFYSGFSLGAYKRLYKDYGEKKFNSESELTADLTLFGFMFGTKVYGFGELGTYQTGVVRAGIGYRF